MSLIAGPNRRNSNRLRLARMRESNLFLQRHMLKGSMSRVSKTVHILAGSSIRTEVIIEVRKTTDERTRMIHMSAGSAESAV